MFTSKAVFVFLAASTIFNGGDAFRKKKGQGSLAQTETVTIGTQERMTSRQQKHSETLSNLQTLARQVVSGEEKITPASKLALASIATEMLAIIDDTAKQHTENKEEVDSARDAISFCGIEATEKHTNASGINDLRDSVDQGRNDHNKCRIMEKDDLTNKAHYCGAFQTYNDNLSPPPCAASFPDGPSDSRLDCISKLKEWSHQHDREYREKKKLCDDATLVHHRTKTSCNKRQASFEEGFCTYASTLSEACESQTRCRTQFQTARDKTHSQVKVAEIGRKAELKSAKMIMCLLDVLNAKAAEMPGLLSACEKLAVDTSSLDMVYPAIPDAAACDPSPVASKPCGESWLSKEYEIQSDWYDFSQGAEKVQPSTCVACIEASQQVSSTYLQGGKDGSCPAGSARVQTAECQGLAGVALSNGKSLSSYGREDCASHFTPGAGCFFNVHGNTYSTTDGCAVAAGVSGHLAVCKSTGAIASNHNNHIPQAAAVPVNYNRKVHGCVNGHNIRKYPGKTVTQCASLCDAEPSCLAFEYGVAYGGAGGYKAHDCQLQNSANFANCDGSHHNLDLYIK